MNGLIKAWALVSAVACGVFVLVAAGPHYDNMATGLPLSGGTMSGTLDMNANPITNVGNASTDFSATGGLELATGVTVDSWCEEDPLTGTQNCFGLQGLIGGTSGDSTDPAGLMLRGKSCNGADASCTAGNVVLTGGSGVIDIQIDGADPSVTCAGDNDSVTFSVFDSNGTMVINAVQLLEGTNWTATASVANTCASLAAAFETACTVSSVDYCNATCASPEVEVTLTNRAAALVDLTESTGACTTTATLARGQILLPNRALASSLSNPTISWAGDTNCGISHSATDTFHLVANGASVVDITAGIVDVNQNVLSFADQNFWVGSTSRDQFSLGVAAATGNSIDILPQAAYTTDCAYADATNPTLRVHSAAASCATNPTEHINLSHDATNGIISTGTGDINMTPNGSDVNVTGNVTATGKVIPAGAAFNVGTTCSLGEVMIDTGGATVEICVCTATDTIRCVPTTTTNPAD